MAQKIPILDPLVQKFLDTIAAKGGAPLYTLQPAQAREILNQLQAEPIEKLPADIEDRDIPVGPKGKTSIRIIRPQGNKSKLPVVMYFHGGGWVLGNKETHDRLMRELAHGAQAAIVFVDYVNAPESQYPAIHEECFSASQWIAENGASLNLDTSRMLVAGDSVGGQLATAVAMMAKEGNGPTFLAQLLFYPVTDAHFDTESYKEFANGYWLARDAMRWFWDMYVPDVSMRAKHLVSPLQATLKQLEGLPPTLIIVDENDVLRDEGEAYARKLMQAGVQVTACRYVGLIHDFMMLNGFTKAPGVRAAINQATDTIRHVFLK